MLRGRTYLNFRSTDPSYGRQLILKEQMIGLIIETPLTNDQIIAEVLWTAKIIRDITGVTRTLIRPPCKFEMPPFVQTSQ